MCMCWGAQEAAGPSGAQRRQPATDVPALVVHGGGGLALPELRAEEAAFPCPDSAQAGGRDPPAMHKILGHRHASTL
jgi:hypothetical protein